MKPQIVGPACGRVQEAIDGAMAEGVLRLPAELAAHAQRCARCGAEVTAIQGLLGRLQDAAATLPMGPVPGVVDAVIARTTTAGGRPDKARPGAMWVLGQVAAVAAALLILISGVSYALLKVNQAVSGTEPVEVVHRLTAPLTNWNWARIKNAK